MLTCCLSGSEREKKRVNQLIEKQIEKEKKYLRKEIKLILFGTEESGKSTFIKQIRIIHGSGYSEDERLKFIPLIYKNIYMAMSSMIKAMELFDIPYENEQNQNYARLIQDAFELGTDFEKVHVTEIRSLWSDSGIRECYRRRREYQISDSAKYFLDSLERISKEDYSPTEQDVLRARMPTTGIQEYAFVFEHIAFRVIDLPGQRHLRHMFTYCLEENPIILFLASLSEYDQTLVESSGENRMRESVALFRIILNSRYLTNSNTSFVLFLNKKDLLEEKILHSHLKDYFPQFDGERQDSIAAREFILKMYLDLDPDNDKQVYSHFTCATDTENIKFVFAAVRDTILQSHLVDWALM